MLWNKNVMYIYGVHVVQPKNQACACYLIISIKVTITIKRFKAVIKTEECVNKDVRKLQTH